MALPALRPWNARAGHVHPRPTSSTSRPASSTECRRSVCGSLTAFPRPRPSARPTSRPAPSRTMSHSPCCPTSAGSGNSRNPVAGGVRDPVPSKAHVPARRAQRVRDIDRVRCPAVPASDQPPVAQLSGPDIVFPGIPVQFSARGSADPDLDLLTFHWDFGDGSTSDDRNPTHVFADTAADLTVRLTVSDGQQAVSSEKTLFACPALDAGRTPGTLKIEASGPLEFGSVAPGTSATRTLTVRNVSTDPTSQLKGRLEVGPALPPPAADSSGFTVAPAAVDLGAGETSSVTVTFAPTTAGHRAAHLVLVACATNRPAAHLWAHGFGGSGAGPVFAAEPLFFADLSGATFAILADGTRVPADNPLHSCQNANGTGTSDLCATNADCVTPGETCALTSVCVAAARPGQRCTPSAA